MATERKITRDVIESYLHCKTKAALKLAMEDGTKSDYEIWSTEQITRENRGATDNLIRIYNGRTVAEKIALTAPMMKTAPDVILNGRFEDESLSIFIDALVRDDAISSKRRQPTYIPVLFHGGEIRAAQKILLEIFALLISGLQHQEPTVGLVFRSDGKPKTVRLEPGLKIARSTLCGAKELYQGSLSPMLVLNNHCQICEFQSHCRAEAVKQDNLSLLQGIKESQITRLNRKGIFTINQLSYTFEMRRRPKRVKKIRHKHEFSLRALALREKKTFVHNSPTIAISDTRIYLDIEGTPQHGTYYLIGVITVSGGREVYEAYWANSDSESDQRNIFAKLLDHLRQFSDFSLLHFGSYEVVALRRMRTLSNPLIFVARS
jgi:predicted RecB family nuclease